MRISCCLTLSLLCLTLLKSVNCEIEYNSVNPDGSYSFRHINNDIGSYYHSVAGSPNNSVRGRYGSRNPSNGKVEETIYTAGARGFRVNGPQIHRKMDLSQIPKGPIGSLHDPLADPYDDPTYSFNFKTLEHSRNENADSTGRIRGLYSFLDDIGERHSVRYAAGAGTGFEVLNTAPDNLATIAYNAPLYKAPPKARGKISIQRGPKGLYKFIATGPDQRRTEVSGPDGIVRGSYSYLDDKGVQRTVKYEAGAGIGYRIVQNTVGQRTHIKANIPELFPNDLYLKEYLQSYNDDDGLKDEDRKNARTYSESNKHKEIDIQTKDSTRKNESVDGKDISDEDQENESYAPKKLSNFGNKNSTTYRTFNRKQSSSFKDDEFDTLDFDKDLSSLPPFITSNRRLLEVGRKQDWNLRNRDSTIITNVGKWFIGIPPGQSVRAHVQNIDILPIGGRVPSPSEALHNDELTELMLA